jgi:hypothetical protein
MLILLANFWGVSQPSAWSFSGQVIFSVTIVSAVVYIPIWLFLLDSNLTSASSSEILLVPGIIGFHQEMATAGE